MVPSPRLSFKVEWISRQAGGGNIRVILGLYRNNGKENGNYYMACIGIGSRNGFYKGMHSRDYVAVVCGLELLG